MKVKFALPFFDGFYESVYYNSDTEYYAIQSELDYYRNDCGREDVTEDNLEFDYDGYIKDCTKAFVDAWWNNAPTNIVSKVGFSSLQSPREYNFTTDDIIAEVELTEEWESEMREFIENNKDWLRERIKKDWSCSDGFISFVSNNLDNTSNDDDKWNSDKSWYHNLFVEKDVMYIGLMIGYMMLRSNKNIREWLIEETMSDVCDVMYVHLKEPSESESE